GATFTINASNPSGIETAQLILPSDGWSSQQSGQGPRLRFVNRTAPAGSSLVRSVVIRPGFLKLKAEATGITLDEASQVGIVVRLDAGASSWCSDFGANIVRNEPGLFKAKAQGQPPGACTPQTTTSTSSTSSTLVP